MGAIQQRLSLWLCLCGLASATVHTIIPGSNAGNFSLAVVRPFIESDAEQMTSAMLLQKAWKEACQPRKAGAEQPVDLIFYFNKDIDTLPNLKAQLERLAYEQHMDVCFNSVKIISANLRPDMDGYPKGACNQFFRLFIDDDTRSLIGSYSMIFYMEPDVTPLQPFWLDRIRSHAVNMVNADAWVSGPTYDSSFVPEAHKYSAVYRDNHINGNSLYRFNSPQYIDFLRGAYTEATDNCNFGDYDHRIWQYMMSHHTNLWQQFQPTNLIAHCKASAPWDPELMFVDAQTRYPEAVLIHSLPLKERGDAKGSSQAKLAAE